MNNILCAQLIPGFESLTVRQKEDLLEHWEKEQFSLKPGYIPLLDTYNGQYSIGGNRYQLICPLLQTDLKAIIFSYLCAVSQCLGENVKIQTFRPELYFFTDKCQPFLISSSLEMGKYSNAITKMYLKEIEDKRFPVYLITSIKTSSEQNIPEISKLFYNLDNWRFLNSQQITLYCDLWLHGKENEFIQFYKKNPQFGFVLGNDHVGKTETAYYFSFKANTTPFNLPKSLKPIITENEWKNLQLYTNKFLNISIVVCKHQLKWCIGTLDEVIFDIPRINRNCRPKSTHYIGVHCVGPRRMITPFSEHRITLSQELGGILERTLITCLATGLVRSKGRSWEFEVVILSTENGVLTFVSETFHWIPQRDFDTWHETVYCIPKFRTCRHDDGIHQRELYDNFYLKDGSSA
jgi:hypothetical protein